MNSLSSQFCKKCNNSARQRNVLYIEDNSTNRQLVRYIIEMRPGFTLLEAEDGTQGLELVKRTLPELILVDIQLPDMDGFTVLKHLRNDPQTSSIPVVALSGNSGPDAVEKAIRAGFTKFLPKPIVLNDFFHMLDTVMDT